MPRELRLEYPGAMRHVMSRGDQREDLFLDDVDQHNFIKTLAEVCQKTVSVTPGISDRGGDSSGAYKPELRAL